MMVRLSPPTPVVVVAALALAQALGGCRARDPEATEVTDPFGSAVVRLQNDAVAAEVDGTPIFVSDVQREAVSQGVAEPSEVLDPAHPRFAEALEDLVHRRILALEALRRDLEDSDEAKRRLAAAREVILYNMLIETVLDDAITEEALQALYTEQSALVSLGEEVRARHILVGTLDEAEQVRRMLAGGRDFAELAAEVSLDVSTRGDGGDLGYFARGDLASGEIERAAFATDVGATAEPFRSAAGWHVLRVEERREEEPPTFEEMRPDLVRFLTYQELQRLSDVLMAGAEVRRFANPAPSAAPEPDGAEGIE